MSKIKGQLPGVDDPREIEGYTRGARYLATLHLTDGCRNVALPLSYRMAFRIASVFTAAREAHRVIAITVGRE